MPALVCLGACGGHQVMLGTTAPATAHEEPPGYEVARVLRVIDGDTIEAQVTHRVEGPGAGDAESGRTYSVRLLGIDTPESVKPNSPVECFGKEAFSAARVLLEGREIRLVADVEEADAYGRLLRYVYFGDEMANARLVVNGYANAYTYPPNVRHSELLLQLERFAREENRGLWSPDTCSSEP